VVFEDDGPGYPYHLINKELSSEPLWRGGEGILGLGIEICTAIVELHGGELRLCSRPDNIRGARTEIALPIISSSGKHPVKIYEQ